jgi:hypothetical protein
MNDEEKNRFIYVVLSDPTLIAMFQIIMALKFKHK